MSFAPKNILVAVPCDGPDAAEIGDHLLDAACDLAKPYGARLLLVTAAPPLGDAYAFGPDVTPLFTQHIAEAERARAGFAGRRLDALASRANVRGVPATTMVVTDLQPVPEAIARVARGRFADLVVACTHGRRGLRRALLGSVAERLVRICDTPVLLVRPPWPVDLDERGIAVDLERLR